MSLSDYLKCPGPEREIYAIPEEVICPKCGTSVEIWSDEKKRRCYKCNIMIEKKRPQAAHANSIAGSVTEEQAIELIQEAITLGASDAQCIRTADIVVDEELASLCGGSPRCENYSISASCPPHVPGPLAFTEWQEKSTTSLVVRIDLPSSVMFSSERRGIMRLLHELVAGIELRAVQWGFTSSRAFAGGSCKRIFCEKEPDCSVVSEKGGCRHPEAARPSMSGFGVNVTKLMQSAGWDLELTAGSRTPESQSMTWVAGLIMIGDGV